jgi:hypothetical protein
MPLLGRGGWAWLMSDEAIKETMASRLGKLFKIKLKLQRPPAPRGKWGVLHKR